MIANAWLLAIVIAQSGVQSAANAPEVPAAAIHGHVLRPDGEPAIRAEVRLISAGRFAKSQVAVTDQDGVYRFDDLTPGPYRMVAQKSGFVSIQYGGRPITETPDILMLNPGELRDHVDIRLVRHSAIT